MKETYKLYDNKTILTFDPTKHLYEVDSKKVFGVTSVVGVIDKPALKFWAVNKALESILSDIKPNIPYDEVQLSEAILRAKKAHTVFTEKAANVGTMVHEWLSDYVTRAMNGKGSLAVPTNPQMANAVHAFLEWDNKNNIEWILSERKVYSKNHHYAGTVDAVAVVNGELSIIDWKTSNAIYPEYFLQVAAYAYALQEELGYNIKNIIIVRIGKDGELEVAKRIDIAYCVEKFLACLAIYNWQMINKDKQINGEVLWQ